MTDTPKPTPGAMRAARQIFDGFSHLSRGDAAAIIDRETAAPDLLEACKALVVPYPKSGAFTNARAAIKRAEG